MKLSNTQRRQAIWERLKTFGFPDASVAATKDGVSISYTITMPATCTCGGRAPICQECEKKQKETEQSIRKIVNESPTWGGGKLLIDITVRK